MDVRSVLVIGAGTMGHGIAQVAAAAGREAALHDVSDEAIARGIAAVGRDLARGVEKGKVEPETRDATLAKLTAAPDLDAAAAGADLIVEAVPEDLDLKRSLFSRLAGTARRDAVLATNTSSLSIDAIAGDATGPERIVGMHFFNPVPRMPLLEIVR
ncbi:MAG: 3-hydroxyacyl-CoA dehydrogenase NAD-binding domain-containing protein, partial [Planctomycetota bacterium]|nr:3-hydroxyacyl-CoA dehydrogenase NAD-binding domain-containing protein [Planctomycetota bacterium]